MSWYRINHDSDRATVFILDDIGHGATFEDFDCELGGVQNIELVINSSGGSSGTALEVCELLQRRERVTAYIHRAYSSAATICLGAKESYISNRGTVMIHSPRAPLLYATAEELLSWAGDMVQLTKSLKRFYFEHTRASQDQIAHWFNGEDHYLTPSEAITFGFAQGIFTCPNEERETRLWTATTTGPEPTPDEQVFAAFLRSFRCMKVSDRAAFGRELGAWFATVRECQ